MGVSTYEIVSTSLNEALADRRRRRVTSARIKKRIMALGTDEGIVEFGATAVVDAINFWTSRKIKIGTRRSKHPRNAVMRETIRSAKGGVYRGAIKRLQTAMKNSDKVLNPARTRRILRRAIARYRERLRRVT